MALDQTDKLLILVAVIIVVFVGALLYRVNVINCAASRATIQAAAHCTDNTFNCDFSPADIEAIRQAEISAFFCFTDERK